MRFINLNKQAISSELVVKFDQFFPIIKDINVDVNMTTNMAMHTVNIDIQLQKI